MRVPIICILISAFTISALAQQNTTFLGTLPASVTENSGLIFYNGRLITHNDSGNLAQLIEIDTSNLEVIRTISITNAVNNDWEDITQDDTYIYVGDIGNFNGDRTDLTVYRIDKSIYDTSTAMSADVIRYSYEDQTDFTPTPSSDWDSEALIALGNQLIIFTKQWQGNGTTAYSLPKTPGNHVAMNAGSFDSQGLITGASWNFFSNVLYLLGYSNQLLPFVVRIENIGDSFTFNASAVRSSLPIGVAQAEGITFSAADVYFVSTERFSNESSPLTLDQSLFRFETDDVDVGGGPDDPPPDPIPEGEITLILFREFASDLLQYEINVADEEIFGRAIFDVTGRLLQYTPVRDIDSNSIDISTFSTSVYYLTIYLRNKIVSKAFVPD